MTQDNLTREVELRDKILGHKKTLHEIMLAMKYHPDTFVEMCIMAKDIYDLIKTKLEEQ